MEQSELAKRVLPIGFGDRYSIGMDDAEMRPHMFEIQDNLNALATESYERHQQLVRAGRRILGRTPAG